MKRKQMNSLYDAKTKNEEKKLDDVKKNLQADATKKKWSFSCSPEIKNLTLT
jgi:hypothetical protein